MTNQQIEKLDYFDKAQLYHNVYINKTYFQIPSALRCFYIADGGLEIVKATISNAHIKDPYEIAKLIKALNPEKPQTLQEIYARAEYLANLCDTSVKKVLESDIFNTRDFIPQLDAAVLKKTLTNKTTGMLVPLKPADYTPADDDDTPTPGPTPSSGGDYAEENKIYFMVEGNDIICDTSFNDVIAKLPKLPEAELILDEASDYQNILNISCGYNAAKTEINFNFIRLYDTEIKFFTIHYTGVGISIEENTFVISNGGA
jgi:hypothetical protein